ncbi:DUF4362 domain-containing protein [Virgibacillus sp. Bac332]|uniref:DUF4362 domain-containing protein n=1 Tax=Virgibacillus sp. Bac332 TaxID=2419842 RepID=UPI0013CE7964|nr:DUF4362 domain-containing protein [Virgibacillus sp. Bac332]
MKQETNTNNLSHEGDNVRKTIQLVIILLVSVNIIGCSQSSKYDSKEAIKKGDVVYSGDNVYNLDIFLKFLDNIHSNKKDSIRITSYTNEGDPIFQDLNFDGNVINYSYDNRYDDYGGGDVGVKKDDCENIKKERKKDGKIEYFIVGCSKKPNDSYLLIRTDE